MNKANIVQTRPNGGASLAQLSYAAAAAAALIVSSVASGYVANWKWPQSNRPPPLPSPLPPLPCLLSFLLAVTFKGPSFLSPPLSLSQTSSVRWSAAAAAVDATNSIIVGNYSISGCLSRRRRRFNPCSAVADGRRGSC